jgi:hypothetical protein
VLFLLAQSTYIALLLFNDIVTSTASTALLFDEVYTLLSLFIITYQTKFLPSLGAIQLQRSPT